MVRGPLVSGSRPPLIQSRQLRMRDPVAWRALGTFATLNPVRRMPGSVGADPCGLTSGYPVGRRTPPRGTAQGA